MLMRSINISILLALALVVFCAPAHAVVLDRIVAVVNNDAITWLELYDAMEAELADKLKGLGQEDRKAELKGYEAGFLDAMVMKHMQLQEAERLQISVSELEVDSTIESIRQKYGLSEPAFREAVESSGATWKAYRQNLREQVIIRKLVDRAVASKVKGVRDVGAADKAEAKYHLRQVFIGAERPDAELRERVEAVYKALDTGEAFQDVARRLSEGPNAGEGGDLGVIEGSLLSSEMLKALEGIDTGGISGPVLSGRGVHVLQLVSRASEAVDRIEAQFDDRYSEWIMQLKGRTHIDIRL